MNLTQMMHQASDEQIAQRLATCRACEFRGEIPMVRKEFCKACGCPLASKTKFLKSTCPKGKW